MQSEIEFRRSTYSAIISDLHLCEAEPVNARFPLWKKFKTRQYFFDDVFENFLAHLKEKSNGSPIELILNGDIFDFDSVISLPDKPDFRVSWLEKKRGLFARPERSKYKIEVILKDHEKFVLALRQFIIDGNKVVLVIGNHDLEIHFPNVQATIIKKLNLPTEVAGSIRFADWFYISNEDTLVEHGNQYDPYCVCEDPVNPFSQGYNYKFIRLPFGNLACRYILNGMGFFNPHVDTNYIMSLSAYVRFFFKYMARAQPDLILVWFGGALATLWNAHLDRLHTAIKDPLKIEDRVNQIAMRANAEARMVREMKELIAPAASKNIFLLARELWLDRALFIFIGFAFIFEMMLLIRQMWEISFFWAFIPLFLLLPFFLFYSKSVTSLVSSYKEPDEKILSMTSAITKVNRIVYGHTHTIRHEMIGAVEHLNSGTWSPAFTDVECTKSIDQKTFVWLEPDTLGSRSAKLMKFENGKSLEVYPNREKRK